MANRTFVFDERFTPLVIAEHQLQTKKYTVSFTKGGGLGLFDNEAT